MKTGKLEVLEKTIFPTGDHFSRHDPTEFPKKAILRLNQVPGLCDDEAVLEAEQLPPTVHVEGEITGPLERCDQVNVFNEKVLVSISIPNENAKTDHRQWSFKLSTRPLKSLDLPFNAHVPAIHCCTLSKAAEKPYIGHGNTPEATETAADVFKSNKERILKAG